MITRLIKKVVGTRNDRVIKSIKKIVHKVNQLEPEFQSYSDAALQAKTPAFKARLAEGETLNDILPEAFAMVRESCRRTLGMRHFDVQIIGGVVLHDGKIAEMRTGEGKTLVATLPVYLNALTEKGVHLVTVNDYLVERDANWMRPLYEFMGLSVGINLSTSTPEEKTAAYAADVTYGTNNEFGFDYLRDNMVFELEQRVQRPLHYCVVDEVDSILIDEARTPLVISGAAEESSAFYAQVNKLVPKLDLQTVEEDPKGETVIEEADRGDFTLDEKHKQVSLTEQGHEKLEGLMVKIGLLSEGESLYDYGNITLMHYVLACLRAHHLFQRDVDYIVKDGEIMIVDEHTGRLMEGRRWSDGLHQAVEAKEGLDIQVENHTLATITFQNYFRMYEKLSGMTGTADTEAYELQKIYGLEVIVIPTNKPMARKDHADKIYLTQQAKYDAVIQEIKSCYENKQPVLVGTASVETSELVSLSLTKEGVPHQVLNAKQHEKEAGIIAQAGRPGAVTLATNMAGRGTDIMLGGSLDAELAELDNPSDALVQTTTGAWKARQEAVLASGGLHVLGTERHESRRIDNQLRGRSGRQGDAGSSQFYLSMEDNLLRIFASERVTGMLRKLGLKEDEAIQHSWISRAVENAQRRVEGMNYDIRKNLLEYDDVANDQRKIVYQQRLQLLESDNIKALIDTMLPEVVQQVVERYIEPQSIEEAWDVVELEKAVKQLFSVSLPVSEWLSEDHHLQEADVHERILDAIKARYQQQIDTLGEDNMRQAEKGMMLQLLDSHWKDHLAAMDHMRQSIYLRGYAQKNPAQEYKRESFDMFTQMWGVLKEALISQLCQVQIKSAEELASHDVESRRGPSLSFQHAEFDPMNVAGSASNESVKNTDADAEEKTAPFVREGEKVGRNDPCPCNSGKKYKQCHGKL